MFLSSYVSDMHLFRIFFSSGISILSIFDVVVVHKKDGLRGELMSHFEHVRENGGAQPLSVEASMQHLIVDVVVLEFALVASEQVHCSLLQRICKLRGSECLEPVLTVALCFPEYAMASHWYPMLHAEVHHLICVLVIELPTSPRWHQ